MNITAVSAASSGMWGLLIGSLFLMPVLGAALGVACRNLVISEGLARPIFG